MLIGEKKKLALEVSRSDLDLGKVFLYINGLRFGNTALDYDVCSAINNVVQYFKAEDLGYMELWACPPTVLLAAFDEAYENDLGVSEIDEYSMNKLNENEVNKYHPGFFQRFSEGIDLDKCNFRLGNYLFDNCTLIMIPKGKELRICARDDLSGNSTAIETTKDEFIGLWKGALGICESKRGEGGDRL